MTFIFDKNQNMKKIFKRKPRYYIDCREYPSNSKCSLYLSGKLTEVLNTYVHHAVEVHGHKNTPELRKEIRKLLQSEKNKI